MALVDRLFEGDKAVAERLGVTRQTLFYWRGKLESDPEVLTVFDDLRQKRLNAWTSELPPAITACAEFIKRAATEASHKNPESIKAVAVAMKTLNDVLTDSRRRLQVEDEQ